jgi:hypothetical protein
MELGLGAGWLRSDYEGLGLPYDSAGVHITRLPEALMVIKSFGRCLTLEAPSGGL